MREPASQRIRGLRASASLKLLAGLVRAALERRIRGLRASASLKRVGPRGYISPASVHPRPTRLGLIEALARRKAEDFEKGHPRPTRLGLIEASKSAAAPMPRPMRIRGLRASASLKP